MSLLLSLFLTAAPGPTTLTLDVQPEDTIMFLDGKKKGTASKPMTFPVTPGRHVIKLQRKGESHEEDIEVKKGEKKTFKWAFESGAPPAQKAAPKEEGAAPSGKNKEKDKPAAEEKRDDDLPLDKL